ACTSWPTSWDSTWYDSSYGTVTFTSSTNKVSGYSITAYSSTVTSWTCQYEDTNVEINAGNARVLIVDAAITQPSSASGYCSPSSGPSAEEFIMLVKQGYEANVKQTCPTPLQGVFSYTSNDGSTSSCGSGSQVDVCTSTDTMTYDYTKCSTVQAYSQEGEVYCVSHVTSGSNYFVYALNPGTVDNTNYYRFTCFVNGVCSFPKEWNSVWYDSWSGNVSIVRFLGIVIGWEVKIYSVTLDSWTCQYDDKENNYLVFRADNQVNMNGTLNNAYLCLKWQYITDYSYVYYLQSDINRHAGNSRILLTEDSILQPNDTSGYCSPKFGPTVEEFRILVKKGKESEVKQKCSSELLGTFHYIYTDNKETSCVEESTLDVCKTGNTMIFNYTQCGTAQAYSGTFSYVSDDGSNNHCVNETELDVCTNRTQMIFNYTLCNVTQAYSDCEFPDEWNSTWYDSRTGELVMNDTSSIITGWEIKPFGLTTGKVLSWSCLMANSTHFAFSKIEHFLKT
ncbi:hypothetical protein KUTeg_024641, partial [Tegillarca granosa]